MTRGVWPFPGHTPTAIRRQVAGAYRAALYQADPKACAELDARMVSWGQQWVVDRVLSHDVDAWLSASEAADLAGVEVWSIAQKRRAGKLSGRKIGKVWQYRARDVMAAYAGPPSKAARERLERVAGREVIDGWRG